MVDPTSSQTSAKLRKVKEGLLRTCCEQSRRFFNLGKFSDAIYYGEQAIPYCDELGNEEEAQNMHQTLYLSYISLSNHFEKQVGRSEDALENAKLALKHCKEIENKEFRRLTHQVLALVFLKLQDFGEALINGAEWLSYFEENHDIEEKHEAQWTMASTYYSWALNSLNNKQFKEASDDGELALMCYKDNKSLIIQIRWLLAKAYFLQKDFKNALKQFYSDIDMLSQERDAKDYIIAGEIHQALWRYDEAKMYFEKAEKDANKKAEKDANKKDIKLILKKRVNELIREANKLIKDEAIYIPQMLKDPEEKDIGKQKKILGSRGRKVKSIKRKLKI